MNSKSFWNLTRGEARDVAKGGMGSLPPQTTRKFLSWQNRLGKNLKIYGKKSVIFVKSAKWQIFYNLTSNYAREMADPPLERAWKVLVVYFEFQLGPMKTLK